MIARLTEWRGLLAGPVEVCTFREVTPRADESEGSVRRAGQ